MPATSSSSAKKKKRSSISIEPSNQPNAVLSPTPSGTSPTTPTGKTTPMNLTPSREPTPPSAASAVKSPVPFQSPGPAPIVQGGSHVGSLTRRPGTETIRTRLGVLVTDAENV